MKLRKVSLSRMRRLDAGKVLLSRLFAPTVSLTEQFKLATAEGEDDTPETRKKKVPKYKWLHVASEGEFAGHADGEFELNRAVFTEFIKNFHADPRYKAPTAGFTEGTDGGMKQVLPFDFEHASELAATEGSIPVTGAPAPAWAMEVELRDGADGTAQLWAYAKLGDRIRSYIAEDEYRHVSIAFALDASDPETDASIGARLSSIAFTNHPFLRGLTSIAARDGGAERRLLYWYDAAGSPEQGMEYTRKCLGLGATADSNEVKAEVTKIAGFAADPSTIPPGVDLAEIFSGLRKIWSLPVSSTVTEITAEIDKAAAQITAANAAVAAAAANAQPAPAAAPTPPPAPAPAPVATSPTLTDQGKKPMKEFIARLLKALKPLAKSKGVKLTALSDRAADIGNAELTDEQAQAQVLGIITELVTLADGAGTDLASVLSALGVSDAAASLAAIPELMGAKAKLTTALQQLDEAMAMQAEVDTGTEEADVEAAASAKGLSGDDGTVDAGVANALRAYRNSVIAAEVAKLGDKDKTPKKLRDARQAGRTAFLTEYGVVEADRARLLKNIVAGPNGQQLTPPVRGQAPRLSSRDNGDGGDRRLSNRETPSIDLSACEGPNQFARLMSHVRLNEKGFLNATHDQVHSKARALKQLASRGEIEIIDPDAEATAAQ
jgi:hypothetical protein